MLSQQMKELNQTENHKKILRISNLRGDNNGTNEPMTLAFA